MPRHDDIPLPDADNDRPFAFISYARLDRGKVYREVDRLKGEGYRLWIDKADIIASDEWLATIRQAIRSCSRYLSSGSPWRSSHRPNWMNVSVRSMHWSRIPNIRASINRTCEPQGPGENGMVREAAINPSDSLAFPPACDY
jgi:hypothetical protein